MHLADGSPELIRRDSERGYVAVGVPVPQVCLGNPRVQTEYVWFQLDRSEQTCNLAKLLNPQLPLPLNQVPIPQSSEALTRLAVSVSLRFLKLIRYCSGRGGGLLRVRNEQAARRVTPNFSMSLMQFLLCKTFAMLWGSPLLIATCHCV